MNAVRTSFALRIATVTVAFFAWLVLSNHCVLAEMLVAKSAPVSTEKHGCCKHQPAPSNPRAPMQECCKSLTVVVPDGTKAPSVSSSDIVTPPGEWLVVFTVGFSEENSAASDAGPPPDVPSVVELVLHRSLHSHAPPFAA